MLRLLQAQFHSFVILRADSLGCLHHLWWSKFLPLTEGQKNSLLKDKAKRAGQRQSPDAASTWCCRMPVACYFPRGVLHLGPEWHEGLRASSGTYEKKGAAM